MKILHRDGSVSGVAVVVNEIQTPQRRTVMRVLNLKRLIGSGFVALLGLGVFAANGATEAVTAQEQYQTCGCDFQGGGWCIDYLYTECSSNADCAAGCKQD